jgi:hypothetical protein
MIRIILSAFSDTINLASLSAIYISEDNWVDNFKELSKATFAEVKAFGIKSRTVTKNFKRSCRLIEAFLQENDLEFSAESADQWLSGFISLKEGTHSQRNLYLSHRRALLLLLDLQNGQLDEWKVYPIKTAQRPTTEHYADLLDQYKQHLILESMSEATITFAMRVVSMFFRYFESMKIDSISKLTTINVSDFLGHDVFSVENRWVFRHMLIS